MSEPLRLQKDGDQLMLENLQLRFVEEYEVKIKSNIPEGKAELVLKMLVNFSDSKQEQNP